MKKVTSLLLALVMALALAVPAFAEGDTIQPEGKNGTQDVTASYNTAADEGVHVYHVTIDWQVPSFTYNFQGTQYTWNPTDLNYTKSGDTGEAKWTKESGDLTLKVKNRSDMPVYCKATLEKNTQQADTLTVNYQRKADQTADKAEAAVTVEGNNWKNYTTKDSGAEKTCDLGGTITVSGTPNKDVVKLATITVTLSKTVLN
mgnify:FL=1